MSSPARLGGNYANPALFNTPLLPTPEVGTFARIGLNLTPLTDEQMASTAASGPSDWPDNVTEAEADSLVQQAGADPAAFDALLRQRFGPLLVGVDEVGRGCYAGPLCAGAVILPPGCVIPGLTDSKKLTERKRVALVPQIVSAALAWGIGHATAEEIDTYGLTWGNASAMSRAVYQAQQQLAGRIQYTIWHDSSQAGEGSVFASVDCPPLHGIVLDQCPAPLSLPSRYPHAMLAKGDSLSQSVAAASVLAKVWRDEYVALTLDAQYPGYGLASHKGYLSPDHKSALRRMGTVPGLHRLSYGGVRL